MATRVEARESAIDRPLPLTDDLAQFAIAIATVDPSTVECRFRAVQHPVPSSRDQAVAQPTPAVVENPDTNGHQTYLAVGKAQDR